MILRGYLKQLIPSSPAALQNKKCARQLTWARESNTIKCNLCENLYLKISGCLHTNVF
jgi:hypothetical protein